MGARVALLRVLRVIVWLLLAWVLLRGVFSFLAPPPAPRASAKPEPAAQVKVLDTTGPGAFAALFAREYLTWQPGGEADRALRLRPFLARRLDEQAGWQVGKNGTAQAVDEALPFRVTPLTSERYLVTVAVRTSTGAAPAAAPSPSPAPAPTVRTLWLAVPVVGSKDGYAVDDYPTLVPPPAAAPTQGQAGAGDEVTDTGDRVRTLLNGFFKAYASGSSAEAAYYLSPGATIRGFDGRFGFESLAELRLFRTAGETRALALVTFVDPVSGATFRQRCTITLEERDGRWYIRELLEKGV